MARRTLQALTFTLGLLTLVLAAMSFLFGAKSPVYGSVSLPEVPELDSNLRFFGGIGIGLGLMLLWTVPAIEERTQWFRAAWLLGFLGGLGRLLSLATSGVPSIPMIAFALIEVVGAPIFVYWQHRLATADPASSMLVSG